jgi:hypothetical protein
MEKFSRVANGFLWPPKARLHNATKLTQANSANFMVAGYPDVISFPYPARSRGPLLHLDFCSTRIFFRSVAWYKLTGFAS